MLIDTESLEKFICKWKRQLKFENVKIMKYQTPLQSQVKINCNYKGWNIVNKVRQTNPLETVKLLRNLSYNELGAIEFDLTTILNIRK